MELKDFIKETLTQIIQGVIDSQKFASENNAKINPKNVQLFNKGDKPIFSDINRDNFAQNVEFDIAITATEGLDSKGGVGVFLGSLGIGGQVQNFSSNNNINRIRFNIPIFLPNQ
jgi:hypothetical protein